MSDLSSTLRTPSRNETGVQCSRAGESKSAGTSGIPVHRRGCCAVLGEGHPAAARLTHDDGAGAHQPDLLLERHPLRGARARTRAGGRRGRRAEVPAPARLLRVAGHVAVPPRPRSLRCPVGPFAPQPLLRPLRPSVRPSVGRSVRASLTAGQRPPAGACAGKRPGPGPVRGRRGPRSGGRRTGSRVLPSARGSPPPSRPERREDWGRCREHFAAPWGAESNCRTPYPEKEPCWPAPTFPRAWPDWNTYLGRVCMCLLEDPKHPS